MAISVEYKATRITTLCIWIVISILFGATIINADEVCKLSYTGYPEDLNGKTIAVPENIVALSEYVPVGTPVHVTEAVIKKPTIFFIIDHSGSMIYENADLTTPRDKWGNRFRVTHDLMDSLSRKLPQAEVGVAVFRTFLYYRPEDDDLFVQCPAQDSGAYIPLLKLSEKYPPDNKDGYQILKKWLEADTVIENIGDPPEPYEYVDLNYKTSWQDDANPLTHINAGFDAAKHAMLASKHPKSNHFIIFLSDGVATYPQDASKKDYVQGTGVPTTFTIYFTNEPNPPQDLVQMTENIKNNGYSSSNPRSNLWAFNNSSYDTLMNFLMNDVISLINQIQTAEPKKIVINGIDPISGWDSTGFSFQDLFPLTGKNTNFVYDIGYKIFIDSVNETGDTLLYIKDTSSHVEFSVTIEPNATLSDSFLVDCWGRSLSFYHNGTPISLANETMKKLEIRFQEKEIDMLYGYKDVSVEITNSEGIQDKEIYKLTHNGSYFSHTFTREIDPTPDAGDMKVGHAKYDSLIATFRNPKLPLDTLRFGIPFRLNGFIKAQVAYYFDNNADGYVDSIFIQVSVDIAGGMTNEHLDEIMKNNLITLPPFRDFTITKYSLDSNGIALHVKEGTSHDPATYIRADDSISFSYKILSIGGVVESATIPIIDKVAPIVLHKYITCGKQKKRTPLLIDSPIDSIPDTLSVTFSEPVKKVNHEVPFYFLDVVNNNTYTADVKAVNFPDKVTIIFIVKSIHDGVERIKKGDSLWIHEMNRVGDISFDIEGFITNNYQNNPMNKRRVIDVVQTVIPVDLIPVAITPMDLSDFNNESIVIPDEIIKLFDSDEIITQLKLQKNEEGKYIGMVIQIVPDFNGLDIDLFKKLELEGDISIFDAVGNQIISGQSMKFNSKNKTLNYIWNIRNANGRTVGAGAYVAITNLIKWPIGKSEVQECMKLSMKVMLGVKD